MKKKNLIKGGAAGLLTLLLTAAMGCFASFAYDSASLKTCTVENRNTVVITGTAEKDVPQETVPETLEDGTVVPPETEVPDDGYYYLFELQPYETGIGSRTDYAAWCDKTEKLKFSLPFSGGDSDPRLYSRFVVALKIGDTYQAISAPIYVTNPGDMASFTEEYPEAMSKKGLLIELDMLGDAMELGVKHTTINIPYHHIIGGNLKYHYNGKDYYFNEELIASYDKMISSFSNKGIIVTAILLNGWNDAHPELHEAGLAKSSSAFYYGFNVSTPEGYETTRALFSFMAERYSGADYKHGRVSNWIVGNEVNNNKNWNYVGPMDLASYTKLYEKNFRVAYTAIKSRSKNARVFFSTDYEWKKQNTNLQYAAKDFIDLFNAGISAEGNIEWGLAYHPYPYPMTEPEFWDDDQTGMVNETFESPVINFKNLHVLTDYFQQAHMRTAGGQVRHIILSEEGFTSDSISRGKVYDIQAAAFAYAYYLVDNNPYIDAFILNRQVDAITEVETSCAFGLWTVDMSRPDKVIAVMPKNIYQVFKHIDTRKSLRYSEFAKSIVGISDWSEVIPGFDPEKYQ
ncbi:MAG: Tat pathway signal protein [Clostridium sp.]|nr:Tat pathway signal protein [Clostridium sp.]